MEYLFQLTDFLSNLIRPYSDQIAVGFVATLLVIFGNDIIHFIKEPLKKLHFIIRLSVLILFAVIGFSVLTNFSNRIVSDFLNSIPNRWFSVVIIMGFIGLGIIAEQKKYI